MEISNIHINQYINGELSGEALASFEQYLKEDESLLKKIQLHQDIDQTLMDNYLDLDEVAHQKETAKLKPVFEELGDQYFKPAAKKPGRGKIVSLVVALSVAAALLIFVIAPFSNITSPLQKVPATELAHQYFEKYTLGTMQGPNEQAVESPKVLLQKGSDNYLNNEMEDAIQSFRKVAGGSSLIYENIANWYLALCYLKSDQPDKAKPVLKQLQQSKEYASKAKDILKHIE